MLWLKCYVASVTITTSNNVDGKRLKFKNFGGQFFLRFLFFFYQKRLVIKQNFILSLRLGEKFLIEKVFFNFS